MQLNYSKNTSSIVNDKWNFSTIWLLRQRHPVWRDWWYAKIWNIFYYWDVATQQWLWSWPPAINWGDIVWNILLQTDLTNYIESSEVRYPKDYIAPTETVEVRSYENYAIYSPLINDWIMINSWTIIFN